MEIGKKISELRKKNNLSQEALSEKMDVTRQTISKWELEETYPDINQAKKLSKIFNVSLDELTDNDIKNILIAKTSNTEKLAGLIIKILKGFGIFIICWIILMIILFLVVTLYNHQEETSTEKSATLSCKIENNDYAITIGSDSYFNCSNCDKTMEVYLKDITDWANIDQSIKNINKYFYDNGGSCTQE